MKIERCSFVLQLGDINQRHTLVFRVATKRDTTGCHSGARSARYEHELLRNERRLMLAIDNTV